MYVCISSRNFTDKSRNISYIFLFRTFFHFCDLGHFFLAVDLEGSFFCNDLVSLRSNPSTFHLKEISIKGFPLWLNRNESDQHL